MNECATQDEALTKLYAVNHYIARYGATEAMFLVAQSIKALRRDTYVVAYAGKLQAIVTPPPLR